MPKVITGEVRFSFVHVFEPHAMNETQEAKYSVSIIIPKSDKKTIAKIKAAIEEAKIEGKAKFGGKIPNNLKVPLRDGDIDREDDEAYAGSMFINANSSRKPGLVDENVDPIMNKDDFYSGCFGLASVNFYPYNAGGTKGIACGLNNLQKLKDGEPLGANVASAADDFGGEEKDDF
jgi:hypothetical protein